MTKPSKEHKGNPGNAASIILPPEAFKQTLIKYGNRQAKTGRTFALLSMQIVNWADLACEKASELASARKHLQESCARAIASALRLQDRLCVLDGGWFFAILPEISHPEVDDDEFIPDRRGQGQQMGEGLPAVRARLATKLNGVVCDLQPRLKFRLKSAYSGEGRDVEDLLAKIGAEIDEHGNFSARTSTTPAWFAGGAFSSWERRYTQTNGSHSSALPPALLAEFELSSRMAQDSWVDGAPVEILTVTPLDALPFSAAVQDELVRKAHALQSLQHPGVPPLIDFFIRDGRCLLLVVEREPAKPLSAYLKASVIDVSESLKLMDQLLGILIYLGTVIPSVVPSQLQDSLLAVSEVDNHLRLGRFHLDVLLSHPDPDAASFRLRSSVAEIFRQIMAAGGGITAMPAEIQELTQLLSREDPGADLTLYRARSVVRKALGGLDHA